MLLYNKKKDNKNNKRLSTHFCSNMKEVLLETAVKTRLLWLLPEGSLKDFLRHRGSVQNMSLEIRVKDIILGISGGTCEAILRDV